MGEEESTTEEEETKSRCIPVSIRKHHEDHQRTMARTQYGSIPTPPRTETNSKAIRSNTYHYRFIYSLRSLIMPQHELKYFVMPLEEMLEQSAPRMLAWATRWKIGIYQSIRQAKLLSNKMTVPIW